MLTSALISFVVYGYALGLIWPRATTTDLPRFLLETSAKALWLAWFVFLIRFWLGLPDLTWALLVIVLLLSITFYERARLNHIVISVGGVGWLAAVFAILMASVWLPAFSPFVTGETSLSGWDINASWNRWAIEFTRQEFVPYNAAYPVFIPALWSLIYGAQGSTEIWIAPKLFLLIFPIMIALCVVILGVARRYLAAGLVALAHWGIFLQNEHLLSGLTDPLLMMLSLASGVMLYVGTLASSRTERDVAILTACLLAGTAAITKQAGVATVGAVFLGALLAGRDQRRPMLWHIRNAALSFAPLATFGVLFALSGRNAVGNLGDLAILSDRAGQGSVLLHAWGNLVDMFGSLPLFLLASCAALNLLNLRTNRHRIGAVFLVTAGMAFFAYARCCSYDERNGWFLTALLTVSAIFGVAQLEGLLRRFIRPHRFWALRASPTAFSGGAVALLFAAFAFLGSVFIDDAAFIERGLQQRREVVWPSVNQLLYEVSVPGKVISSFPFVGILPGFEDRFIECINDACAKAAINANPGSVVLFSPNGFDFPEIRASLDPSQIAASEQDHGFSVSKPLP